MEVDWVERDVQCYQGRSQVVSLTYLETVKGSVLMVCLANVSSRPSLVMLITCGRYYGTLILESQEERQRRYIFHVW